MTRSLGALLALPLALASCDRPTAPPGALTAIATVYPLYEFTRRIAGPNAVVVGLVPPGVEPHDWEPSPQDMARIRKAQLLVYNGAGLEPWIDKLDVRGAGARPRLVRATEGLSLLAAEGGAREDPHVWLDPVLARAMVEAIRAALVAVDPRDAGAYGEAARALSAELTALDAAFAAGLADCPRREIVTSHAAWAYLARRYRLTVVSVMGVSPESEPTPARLAAIARVARENKVKYIFFETLASPRLAETLAREIGAQTLALNPIEGLTPAEAAAGKGYVTLMEDNLTHLRRALDCR